MTRKVGDTLIIEVEPPQQCDKCGKIAELRPYGIGGSKICFTCSELTDETRAEKLRQFLKLYGD